VPAVCLGRQVTECHVRTLCPNDVSPDYAVNPVMPPTRSRRKKANSISSSKFAQRKFWQADGHDLAEINVATAIADFDDPVMEPFMVSLDKVNALAEASAGFIWRM